MIGAGKHYGSGTKEGREHGVMYVSLQHAKIPTNRIVRIGMLESTLLRESFGRIVGVAGF